ncbi:MAG: hypothetical protein H6739_34895 [Alphaproteobacteria bacterium]|nr:hypothetical protein [Alphaproteobacteria bacterium]
MTQELLLRQAVLEWAQRSAAGELSDLDWVETDLKPRRAPFEMVPDGDGPPRFRHMPYSRFLPEAMTEAMVDAQARGEVSAMEAVMMLTARPEWLILARPLLWSPLSPEPRLLAWLVERWGIEASMHRADPKRLSRIAARLPRWRPQRGNLASAIEMLWEGAGEAVTLSVAARDRDGPVPRRPDVRDELFTCRSDAWWALRRQPGAAPQYRVSGGALRHQPLEGPVFELVQEDVLIGLADGARLSRHLIRLLPAWASVRLVTTER